MDKTVSKRRIGIFGGSFDPPHLGHLSLIRKALESHLVDEVWLVPNFTNPWRKAIASARDRLKMCQLLVEDKIRVCDLEIKRRGKSYTIETVLELKKRYPYQFFWLIGQDLISDLERFHQAEKLFREVIFLVFPRTTVSSSEIRRKIKKGESISDLVTKKVENYIREKKLYV